MNKKVRAVVEQLLRACERGALGVTGSRAECAAAADAGKHLLHPPVRFVWRHLSDGSGYTSQPIRTEYLVKRGKQNARWAAFRRPTQLMKDPGMWAVIGYHYNDLAAAKKACVDHELTISRGST